MTSKKVTDKEIYDLLMSAKRNSFSSESPSSTKTTKKDNTFDDTTKAVLEDLNSIQIKKFSNLKDLIVDKAYQISSARKIATKYGEQILVELDENIIFLPKRYTAMKDETLNALNEGIYTMKLTEIIGKTYNINFCVSEEKNKNSSLEDLFNNSNDELGYYTEMNL